MRIPCTVCFFYAANIQLIVNPYERASLHTNGAKRNPTQIITPRERDISDIPARSQCTGLTEYARKNSSSKQQVLALNISISHHVHHRSTSLCYFLHPTPRHPIHRLGPVPLSGVNRFYWKIPLQIDVDLPYMAILQTDNIFFFLHRGMTQIEKEIWIQRAHTSGYCQDTVGRSRSIVDDVFFYLRE